MRHSVTSLRDYFLLKVSIDVFSMREVWRDEVDEVDEVNKGILVEDTKA